MNPTPRRRQTKTLPSLRPLATLDAIGQHQSHLLRSILRRLCWGALLILPPGTVTAHEYCDVEQPQSHAYVGFGVQSLTSEQAYPLARLPGVLESGNAREDERGEKLAFVEGGLQLALSPQHTALVKVSQHGSNTPAMVENLWWQYQGTDAWQTTSRLGRQMMPLGWLNLTDAHARDFGTDPLVLRAALNDAWQVDGMRLDISPAADWTLGAGIWSNQSFPGSPDSQEPINTYSLRLAWRNASWQAELSAAQTQVAGRALVTTGTLGHTHTLPSCDSIDAYRVCFAGESQLVNLALAWRSADNRWSLAGEAMRKKDTGQLDSIYGIPRYQGELSGAWLDLGWQLAPSLQLIYREESLWVQHLIEGANAALIADQSGILDSDAPLGARALVLNWRPSSAHLLSAEWHQLGVSEIQQSAWMLRYQYNFDYAFAPLSDSTDSSPVQNF